MKKLSFFAAIFFGLCVSANAQVPPVPTVGPVTQTLSALNAVNQVSTNGQNSCSDVLTGTFTATHVFEASHDGLNWTQIGSAATTTGTYVSQIASIQGYRVIAFRDRISAYTSGSTTSVITCNGTSITSTPVGVGLAIAFTGTISTGGTVLTFPNSYAFPDTTFVCTITTQGTSPIAVSYDPSVNTTTSIKAYSASGTPVVAVHCSR